MRQGSHAFQQLGGRFSKCSRCWTGTIILPARYSREGHFERQTLMKSLKWAVLAASLVFVPTALTAPASARAVVGIDFGNVAIGYRDGYYDNGHRYHHWARADAAKYRGQYQDHYRDMAHTRDHNRGW